MTTFGAVLGDISLAAGLVMISWVLGDFVAERFTDEYLRTPDMLINSTALLLIILSVLLKWNIHDETLAQPVTYVEVGLAFLAVILLYTFLTLLCAGVRIVAYRVVHR